MSNPTIYTPISLDMFESTQKALDDRFEGYLDFEEALEGGPTALLDALMVATLPDVLGISVHARGSAVIAGFEARRNTLRRAFSAMPTGGRDKSSQAVMQILQRAAAILSSQTLRAAYIQSSEDAGHLLVFQEYDLCWKDMPRHNDDRPMPVRKPETRLSVVLLGLVVLAGAFGALLLNAV